MRDQREIVRRAWARQAVRKAGAPLLRAVVDRARELLDEHSDLEDCALDVTVDALRQEFKAA